MLVTEANATESHPIVILTAPLLRVPRLLERSELREVMLAMEAETPKRLRLSLAVTRMVLSPRDLKPPRRLESRKTSLLWIG